MYNATCHITAILSYFFNMSANISKSTAFSGCHNFVTFWFKTSNTTNMKLLSAHPSCKSAGTGNSVDTSHYFPLWLLLRCTFRLLISLFVHRLLSSFRTKMLLIWALFKLLSSFYAIICYLYGHSAKCFLPYAPTCYFSGHSAKCFRPYEPICYFSGHSAKCFLPYAPTCYFYGHSAKCFRPYEPMLLLWTLCQMLSSL